MSHLCLEEGEKLKDPVGPKLDQIQGNRPLKKSLNLPVQGKSEVETRKGGNLQNKTAKAYVRADNDTRGHKNKS